MQQLLTFDRTWLHGKPDRPTKFLRLVLSLVLFVVLVATWHRLLGAKADLATPEGVAWNISATDRASQPRSAPLKPHTATFSSSRTLSPTPDYVATGPRSFGQILKVDIGSEWASLPASIRPLGPVIGGNGSRAPPYV